MRRGQDEEGGSGSAGASKATSENGSDSKDKQPLISQKYVVVVVKILYPGMPLTRL